MEINKDFVPYEQALELKELGFDEPCFGYWKLENWLIQEKTRTDGYTHADQICSAPIFSQAFRWFKEKCNLPCWVYTSNLKEYWYSILKDGRMVVRDYKPFNTYEEAELECLVKLINIVKKQNLKG